jgi:hypothetical protein
MAPIKTKNNRKGNKTKNQEKFLYPALHIESNTKVQNAIYKNSIKNIKDVLLTGHVYEPIQ